MWWCANVSAPGYKCVRLNRENSIPLLWLNVNVRNENHRGFCRGCAVCVREIRTNYTIRVWKFRVKWPTMDVPRGVCINSFE